MKPSGELHVVFGTGPLGRAVMNALAQRGHPIRAVNRRGQMDAAPDGVELVAGDAYNANVVRELTRGASVAYQCAQPRYTEWPEKFPPLQAAILEGVAANGAKLIIGENLYLYGDTQGRPLTADLPYAARDRKGRTRARMAEAALAAHRAGRVRVAIGRGSDFFGPYVLGSAAGERLFDPLLKGKPAQVAGNVDLPHTYTYINDFGRALVMLGERDEALGQAWHVPNAETITTRQFVALAAEIAGVPARLPPARLTSLGRWQMALAGLFIPEAREMAEMLYEFEQPFVVEAEPFVRTFGLQATPLRQALHETVQWYRSRSRSNGTH